MAKTKEINVEVRRSDSCGEFLDCNTYTLEVPADLDIKSEYVYDQIFPILFREYEEDFPSDEDNAVNAEIIDITEDA